tara:strand:- start:82 stop:267 length:186 start_codon:yes stop_codon:yes gene_type:complete
MTGGTGNGEHHHGGRGIGRARLRHPLLREGHDMQAVKAIAIAIVMVTLSVAMTIAILGVFE